MSLSPDLATRTANGRVLKPESEVTRPSSVYPFLLPAAAPDEIGRLGNYRVLRLLGRGGMAYVFEAQDIALDRRVALKVMKPELHEFDGWQRFLREARTMASIKHDHLVTIYQAGQDGQAVWFSMELLDGETLHEWLRKRPKVEIAEVLRMGREVTDGLAFLHKRGLVHRDIKPANIWLEGSQRRVKILDLGLVRTVDEGPRLTDAGQAVGTPGFMSPEQARGASLDARSDLFSLGCVLYELCTGKEPFTGPSTMAVLTALAVDDPTPIRELNAQVPAPLVKLITRLLKKEPKDRPASATEVCEALQAIERGPVEVARTVKTQVVVPTPPAKRKRSKKSRSETNPRRWLPVILGGTAVLISLLLVGGGLIARSLLKHSGPSAVGPVQAATTYLTDLKPTATENWPIFPPPSPDGKQPGSEVRVGGRLSPHGIFMHPPGMPGAAAALEYRLDGKFARFRVEVSMNDGPGGADSPSTFAVHADNRLVWKSKPVKSQTDYDVCDISVEGVQTLRISVTSAGPPKGAHCVWVEPALAR